MNILLQIFYFNTQVPENKNDFWGISYDAWFTGVVPVLLFILGYIINKIIENIKEKRRLQELEKYFNKLIEILEKPLIKQKEELIKLVHILKQKKDQHFVLNDVTSFHVDQIKTIDNKDLYTIFIRNKKGEIDQKTELYGKLKGSIDHIDGIKKSIKESFAVLSEKYEKYQADYARNIEITDEGFSNMLSSNSLDNKDLFLLNMDKIRFEWATSVNNSQKYTDMYVARIKYLEPVRELCKQNIGDNRAAYILRHIMLCIYAYNNIEELKNVYRRHFLFDAKGLQESYIKIKKVLAEFDRM